MWPVVGVIYQFTGGSEEISGLLREALGQGEAGGEGTGEDIYKFKRNWRQFEISQGNSRHLKTIRDGLRGTPDNLRGTQDTLKQLKTI